MPSGKVHYFDQFLNFICSINFMSIPGEVKGVEIFHWSPTKTYSPLFTQFGENGKLTLVTVTKGDNDEEKACKNLRKIKMDDRLEGKKIIIL
jgi:hypothetical protein